MIRPGLPLAWALLLVAGAWAARPLPHRSLGSRRGAAGDEAPSPGRPRGPRRRLSKRQRYLVMAALTVVMGATWLPAAGLALAAAAASAAVRRRRIEMAEAAALAAEVPDVVDLLAVAVTAGLNVRLAVAAVADTAPAGLLAAALSQASREVAAGARLADALACIPDRLGEPVRPVVAALVDAERYGTPVAAALAQAGADARLARQRRAEEVARRVPVKLLFPLVACILPAFGLLAVAPLIAGGLRALRLP